MVPAYSMNSLIRFYSLPTCTRARNSIRRTYEEILMGIFFSSHAFCVSMVFHSCLQEILVDSPQHCDSGIEVCIEKHPMRLDLKRTALVVSQCG